jgi:hypothetical protein
VLTQPRDPDGLPQLWDSPSGLNDAEADYEMDPDIINDAANNYRNLALQGLSAIPTLSVVMDSDRMWSPSQGFYVRKEGDNPVLQQQCDLELIIPDGSREGFSITAGIKVVGGTSSGNNASWWKGRKLSLRLLFKGEFGANKLNYKLFPDSPADSFDTLTIDAGSNYTWPYNGGSSPDDQRLRAQYIRDQYVSDLQNALGGAAPHGLFVHLYLNGLYWGLHDLHERPDHSFAEAYFGGDKGEYDAIKHWDGNANDLVNGSTAPYASMMTLAQSGLANNSVYEALQQQVDIPDYINYMIANFWTGNDDWAHHNW